MDGLVDKIKGALGLAETTSSIDVAEHVNRLLEEAMSPEDKAAWLKRMIAARKKSERKAEEPDATDAPSETEMAELRGLLGMAEDATLSSIVSSLKALKGSAATLSERFTADDKQLAEVTLQVKALSDKVAVLEPKANEAMKLREEGRAREKDIFLRDQIRAGRLPAAEREFYEQMYDKSEEAVRAFFKDRKPVVKLAEVGLEGEGEHARELTETDPRIVLSDLATKRAAEKNIDFTAALAEVKAENPALVEKTAGKYGVAGIARA